MKLKKGPQLLIGNILFVIICAGLLVFLLNAPKETTSPLPHDEIHSRFYEIASKKEAEKYCFECHERDKEAPLPEGHPLKFRCLLCHKRL
jgi:hypothetical protein